MQKSISRDFDTITLTDVRKHFGRVPVLRGVTAAICRGRIALLAGQNGAGKTTLMTLLSTATCPSGGAIHYGEFPHEVARVALRSQISLLGHSPMLYPELTARENLVFFARLHGTAAAPVAAMEALEHMGLAQIADQPVRSLSHGTRKRVALTRALLSRPRVLLLDEPFNGLDLPAIEKVRGALTEQMQAGCLVLVCSHDLEPLDQLCGQLIVLHKGRVAIDHVAPNLTESMLRESCRGVFGHAVV